MHILVAGGTGVLGRATVPLLTTAGHRVTAVSRSEDRDGALLAAGARPLRLDLFDAVATGRAARGADVVINLATSIPSAPAALRRRAWRTNDLLRRDASRSLAAAASAAGARFVQESFAPTYADGGAGWIGEEHPLAPTFQTGTVVEAEASADLVTARGGTGVVLRFGLFYGADSRDTLALLAEARKGRLMLPGPADRYSSMVHVDDAARAVAAALDLPAGVYNVVEDEPATRGDHAAVLADLLGRDQVKVLPAAVGRLPALRALARSHRISNRRLRAATDWRPLAPTVREGWQRVLEEAERVPG